MSSEFSAREVALEVLEHLEARRGDIASDPARVKAEVGAALAPIRERYRETELPPAYFAALEGEVEHGVPERWQKLAREFTARERAQFGLWRGGDPVARLTYVFIGLVLGGLMVEAPFIPIWEKWFPFALAIGAFFLPDLQTLWHKRRYARALGDIAVTLGRAQPLLDEKFTQDVLLPPRETRETPNNR